MEVDSGRKMCKLVGRIEIVSVKVGKETGKAGEEEWSKR